ncbi:hypothetical protein PIB30_087532, partial [Stylosanthes scabra]|nr:hypothetical protein [Stylosanthes scabra]
RKDESCNNGEEGMEVEGDNSDQATYKRTEEQGSKEEIQEEEMRDRLQIEEQDDKEEDNQTQEMEFAMNRIRARWTKMKEIKGAGSAKQNAKSFSVDQDMIEFERRIRGEQ